ncbi:DNA-directed DNA polymerase [Nakaseomyces bracarensis]|uniref:DNA-directed DNA polymerase n=1 Tax=Nakaseomyces bracarensis TaxID=273131 RepID=UPI003872054E
MNEMKMTHELSCESFSKSLDTFNIQLNYYDYYMSYPTELDTSFGKSLPLHRFEKVPVIRVFGCLPSGHQVLCHIHGIFHYFFVRYDGHEKDSSNVMNDKCAKLHRLLEDKLTEKLKYKKDKNNNKSTNSTGNILRYIANVSVVKAVPFYGYHVGWYAFYKISLLNPNYMETLCNIIRSGIISKVINETYESQYPYLLKFTADYNLFGCSWVNFSKVYFRSPVLNELLGMDEITMTEDLKSILNNFLHIDNNTLPKRQFPRIGNGLLEIDALPHFIRNRDSIEIRNMHQDFSEKVNDTESIVKGPFVNSTKEMERDVKIQRTLYALSEYQKPPEVSRQESNAKWNTTDQYNLFFQKAMNYTRSENKPIDSLVHSLGLLDDIKTPYETLAELWPNEPKFNGDNLSTKVNEETWKNSLEVAEDLPGNQFDIIDDRDQLDDISPKKPPAQTPADKATKIGSIDFALTQNMRANAVKKNLTQDICNINNIDVKSSPIFFSGSDRKQFQYKRMSLNYGSICEEFREMGFPKIDYTGPFFSDPSDLSNKQYIYAGKIFEITSNHVLKRIPCAFGEEAVLLEQKSSMMANSIFSSWKYLKKAPAYQQVQKDTPIFIEKKSTLSQIQKPSHSKSVGDVSSLKRSKSISDNLTHFSLEIHVNTENDMLPNPKTDEVSIIFWHVDKDSFPFDFNLHLEGILIVDKDDTLKHYERYTGDVPIMIYDNEFDMFDALTDLILLFDPDLLSGYEVHNASWGYIFERSIIIHNFNISEEISRVNVNIKNKLNDSWGYKKSSGLHITGRYILNIWRLMRHELSVNQYSFESIANLVLKEQFPHFLNKNLSDMWKGHHGSIGIITCLSYYMLRVRANVKILKKLNFILNVIEQARLIGVDFQSVYNRGSQYKVESFLIRICKSEHFNVLSPSKEAVRNQKPLECVPLVMEPESAFYKSPLLVLDFQSLYPSIVMAYNYCYSTIIGRVRELKNSENTIGVTKFKVPENIYELLKEDIHIAPNGIIYAKDTLRKSTLAKMVNEILEIRFLVKKTISDLGDQHHTLKNLLESKQLALKLLANVTYGYASASFSGRMPCADLADSIVQTGRETLERAIKMIESRVEWGAKVVYGDTDSLFVYLPGRSKKEAFRIGSEMVSAVTASNPAPVKLNFEKVYFPSILLSKKRYVGYAYMNPSQEEPRFDAKGIETVRRDGTPAQQKIVGKALRILFETKDLTLVKNYVISVFDKIRAGKVHIQDFCFAKEIKLGHYKSEKTLPPGAVVAQRMKEKDKRAEPQFKERVSYLVVKGKSGQILRERCVSINEFFSNDSYSLDSEYYITKNLIPPLDRLFNILGISVSEWNIESGRFKGNVALGKNNIENFGQSISCTVCSKNPIADEHLVCLECSQNMKDMTCTLLIKKIGSERELKSLETACRVCNSKYSKDLGSLGSEISNLCVSYDCPIYYSKSKLLKYVNSSSFKEIGMVLDFYDKQ